MNYYGRKTIKKKGTAVVGDEFDGEGALEDEDVPLGVDQSQKGAVELRRKDFIVRESLRKY